MIEVYENKTQNLDIKFSHNQNVEIIRGFYRGNLGTITGYTVKSFDKEVTDDVVDGKDKKGTTKIVKEHKIFYNVNIDSLNIILFIEESDLRDVVKKGFLKNFFRR